MLYLFTISFITKKVLEMQTCVFGIETVHKSKALNCTFKLNLFFRSFNISCRPNTDVKLLAAHKEISTSIHSHKTQKNTDTVCKLLLKNGTKTFDNENMITGSFSWVPTKSFIQFQMISSNINTRYIKTPLHIRPKRHR